MSKVTPPDVLSQVVAGAVAGVVASVAVVKSWVGRVDRKLGDVDRHELRLASIEQSVRDLRSHLEHHSEREETMLERISVSLATLKADVGYLRGRVEGLHGLPVRPGGRREYDTATTAPED